MSSTSPWYVLVPVALVSVAAPAHATQYLTVAQAQRQMFPSATGFIDRKLALDPAQRKAIARAAGVAPGSSQAVWEARGSAGRQGWLFVDRVLGKHELITYALAVDAAGTIRGIEVLEYRETYGGEIRNPRWRQQFVGKRRGAALKLGGDIQNISGATLSSRHVTDGVRRLLVTFDLLLRG